MSHCRSNISESGYVSVAQSGLQRSLKQVQLVRCFKVATLALVFNKLTSKFKSGFKFNAIFGGGVSFTPVVMTPLLMSVKTDRSFRSQRFLCTGGRVGWLLATIHGVHAVCGAVPVH